jgi:ubiquinone/menaquinone biosynthesis C-methylase UbiE
MTEGLTNMADERYLKALRFDALTPLYDFVIRHALPEAEFKRHLVRQADIHDGQRVLDLGCGTATLSVLMKELHPGATIIGLDGDPKILGFAKKKAFDTAADILLTLGMAYELPYADGSFDRVVSSLVLHHLSREQKRRTLRELHRVLRSGGWLHIADWGEARSVWQRIGAWLEQLFDGYDNTSDNFLGRLPDMFAEAGFQNVREVYQYQTLVTGLSLFQAIKA